MDFRDSESEARFRSGLRAWLEANVPKHRDRSSRRPDVVAAKLWSRRLYEAGYAGLTWPEEYGGAGAPYMHQAILLEEMARAEAPEHVGVIGLGMAGPTIIAHGTEEQKKRYLRPILSGDEVWCQGFSEPEAGSDLASLRTRADDDGSDFVVNGQKVWSSFAEIADWCILLARTDSGSSRHEGLTYLLVDMHAPGIEVRPLRQITGTPEFNEIFLTDVRVPKRDVLGSPGAGWQVAMTTLLHERATLGFALSARLDVTTRRLVRLAAATGEVDALARDALARAWIDLQSLRFTNYRALTALVKTGVPGPEGSVAKLHWSEANQRTTKVALDLLGPLAQLDGDDGVEGGYWQFEQLRSRGNTIEAGTSEILRSIVAERVLGLPRSR